MKEQDLILRIFIDGRKVFRESLVKAIRSKLSNASDHLGIEAVFSAFLSELHTSKYKSCPGAFDEGSFHEKNISTINPKSLLIAKEDSRIIYRSRQCQLFVKDGINVKCDSCNWLLKSFQTYCRDHPVEGAVSSHTPMPVQDQPSISVSNQSQPESILADEVSPDNIVTDLSKPSLEELEDQLWRTADTGLEDIEDEYERAWPRPSTASVGGQGTRILPQRLHFEAARSHAIKSQNDLEE